MSIRKKTAKPSARQDSRRILVGRVVDESTDKPFYPALVEARDIEVREGEPLATAKVDRNGEFSLALDKLPNDAPAEIALYVFDEGRTNLLVGEPTRVKLGKTPAEGIVIRVRAPAIVVPIPRDIEEVRARLDLQMPPELSRYLEGSGVATLADLRLKGGLAGNPALPAGLDAVVVDKLDSLAALTLLPTDFDTNAALASSGLRDVLDVARATPASLEQALKDLPSANSSLIHSAARDQASALNNFIVDARVQAEYGDGAALPKAFLDSLPKVCSCCDCQNAMGPIAYLADLLDYSTQHLRNNGQAVTLTFLQDRFHQPFRDLPASCAELDRKVRRLRICIEVLRLDLGARAPTRYPEIMEAAYRVLLANLGTSFEELRQVSRQGKPRQKTDLMARIMLPQNLSLDDLFRDPNAPAGDPLEITETWLNQIFGLRDTRLAPLVEAPNPQETRPALFPRMLAWQRRFLWTRWQREDYSASTPTLNGKPFIDPDVVGRPDLIDVTSNPVARALRPDRTQWSVLDFLEDRQNWIDTTIGSLRASIVGPAAGLQTRLETLLQELQSPTTSFPGLARTGMEGLTFTTVRDLYLRQQNEESVTAELQALEISADELEALGRVLNLAFTGDPILSSELDDFYSIIVGRIKRFGFHAIWKDEERQARVTIDSAVVTGVTLSPFHFQSRSESLLASGAPWSARRWRSTEADRARWEEVLQGRTDQLLNLVTVLQAAVDAAEVIVLREINNLLLRTAQPPGVFLIASTKHLTDRYQIDFQEGTCAWTTRIAQAIETLQDVLFGVRNGLLDDPALTLDDERFDAVWQWLGGYPTWKAAMQVVLYPEILLRPTLCPNPTQGFSEFITNLRSMGRVTPESARSAVAVYEQYFVDVCNLGDGVCTQAPAPGPAGAVNFNYLFARSKSGQLYWCYFDSSDEQSHWRRLEIPALDELHGDLKLFGAAFRTGSAGECFLYFFGQQSDIDEDRIVFARTNLREQADWSELEWESGALKPLPAGRDRFAYARVLTDRTPSEPIKLSVWLSDRDAYVRALNQAGLAWDEVDFANVPATGAWRRLGTGAARGGTDFACSTQQIPPKFILAGDFDRDGQDEIVVIPNRPGTQGNDLWVMKFDAATQTWNHVSPRAGHPFEADMDMGSFSPPAKFAVAGDFDGDGFPEIAIAADMSGGAAGNSDDVGFWVRKFNPATSSWDALGTPNANNLFYGLSFGSTEDNWAMRLSSRFATVGDFDGDGRDEIAVAVTSKEFVEFPIKYNSNTFLVFDLQVGAAGNHTWSTLPNLACEGNVDSPELHPNASIYSRFALAGKFRPGDNRDMLLVGRKKLDGQFNDIDRNLGNDFWLCRFDGNTWSVLDPPLDCANLAIAAQFGIVGDFDGDGTDEVALAQEAMLPGETSFGFWVEKLAVTGAWAPLPDLQYGTRLAAYAVAGDFDGNGADEIAVVTPDVWQSNIHVFGLNNGQWLELNATNRNTLFAGGALTAGLQPQQIPGDQFVVGGVAPRLLPGTSPPSRQLVVLSQTGTDNTARAYAFGTQITGSWSATCTEAEVKPAFSATSPIFAKPDIATARLLNARVPAALGSLHRRTNRDYLDEMLYFVPIEMANRLREGGFHQNALDWVRLAFDYGAPPAQRIVSAKLLDDQSLSVSTYLQWLRDTLNPHVIAATRRNAYVRYTILLAAQCLIDWADAEFARADAESIPEARELYERALDLLNLPEIRQHSNDCEELLSVIAKTIGDDEYIYESVFREIRNVRDPALLATLSQALIKVAGGDESREDKAASAFAMVRAALEEQGDSPVLSFDELRQDASSRLKAMARIVVADESRSNTLMALAKGHLPNEAYREFPPRDEVRFIPAPVLSFCIPPNPALARLRQHAELCLAKIRACKNIAGLDLCLDPYAGSTMELSGADFGQMPSLLASGLQPLPYHYSTLIERTKQLVELARQMESSMLQFISSTEQAQYEELKARQDLELTQAGVQLKQLQVLQASDSVTSANLQRDRAQLQSSHFTELLSNGWTVNEQLQVTNLAVATVHQHAAAIASWVGIWFGTSNAANAIGTSGAAWSMNSQFHGLLASFERRAQEWQFERTLAEQDVRVGEQQITVARDQFAIANQERAIAALQAGHAQTVVNFLTGKFLNADLYEWMADVMGQVYRFFLQQATQLARLAELQLAFERQEPPASLIKADYWERPSTDLTPDIGASSTGTNSVRGLTGSARLLRDIYELDQFAFAKNQRKQQLSETFSLAQLDPFAFQNFRQTGRLPFATPMTLFDRRFPGHYARLIKRVRTSVVALIPPTMGIRATLSSIGPTRVTIGPDVFRTVTMRRDPQLVALTSPFNATGLFDLDAQPELLVPFEGLGVDGQWVFEMPLSANPFDYDAIADVLVTIDYTALDSPDYRDLLVRTMDRRFGADRAFSFRREFEDAWYDLNNPDLVDAPDAPMTVSFTTRRNDFPPHIDRLGVGQVLVQFVQKPVTARVVNVDEFYYTTVAGQDVPAAGANRAAASDATGLISTRRGAWNGLIGGAIDGDLKWTLRLPSALKARFKNEEITDIFLVISYTGLV